MTDKKISAKLSLGICILSGVLLLVWLVCFPSFINWFYAIYHGIRPDDIGLVNIAKIVIPAFYCCAPFAAASIYMLIRLLLNIISDKVFIMTNVKYLRYISWCCYAVCLITVISGAMYFPLMIIAFATGIVGTLLRVVKNIMHSAVELREDNDLTI